MPSLSPTMTQGTISAWKKQPGDTLQPGDILCEIETDKAVVGFEVQDEGVLAKILAEPGPELQCGEPIAILVDDLESYQEFLKTGSDVPAIAPAAVSVPPPAAPIQSPSPVLNQPQLLSPAARHIVTSDNLDISGVLGTARGGRISKEDVILGIKNGKITKKVEASPSATVSVSPQPVLSTSTPPQHTADKIAIASPPILSTSVSSSKAVVADIPTPVGSVDPTLYTDIPNNRMRTVIAKRLTESKKTVPHGQYTAQVEIDELLAFRAKLKSDLNVVVSVNDLVIKAAALALKDVPQANGSWSGTANKKTWNSGGEVDISVAVATPNGLITPIVTGADKRGLLSINAAVRHL